MTRHLGLDLGGTNIKAVVLETANGDLRVAWDGSLETGAEHGPAHVVDRLCELGQRALDETSAVASIGVGVPGAYDGERGIALSLPNIPGNWELQPLAHPLANALAAPATVINDARAFALGESRLGAGRGCATALYFVLGTGVGGAVVIDGRLHLGLEGSAGEVGHITVEPDGPPCPCGSHGCVEALAGANAIERAAGAPTVHEAAEVAERGDARAQAAFSRAGRYLGIAVASAIQVVAPSRVVIGGGVACAGELLFAPLRAEVRERVRVAPVERIEIVAAELGVLGGAIGAAVWGIETAA